MGTLKSMIEFIDSSISTASGIDAKLNKIQVHFNANFNNIMKVRNSEIEFLQNEFFSRPEKFPSEIREKYSNSLKSQEEKFRKNLAELALQREKLDNEIKLLGKNSMTYFTNLKKINTSLDKREEKLKSEINNLENEIRDFNTKIDEMDTGFGFVINFFSMKKIEKQKVALLEKRDALITEIESVRNSWKDKENELLSHDADTKEKWNDLYTELSVTAEKIESLTRDMDILIKKAAFTDTLSGLKGDEKYLTARTGLIHAEKCRKCSSKNVKNLFFCDYCGEPFSDNRGDVEGSLVETGELNRIYHSLTEGIKQSVSFIALIRGIKEGMNTFLKSVIDVKNTEDKYSELPELKIDVPEASLKFTGHLKELEKKLDVDLLNLHPAEFALKMKKETDELFTIKNIELFFTAMGDELNKRTKEQW